MLRGQEASLQADALTFPLSPLTALLVYRVFRNEAKRTTKVLHGLLHVFALVIALVGEFLGAAFPALCLSLQVWQTAALPALFPPQSRDGPAPIPNIPCRATGCWQPLNWY